MKLNPIKQHYLPKVLIKNFVNEKGFLYWVHTSGQTEVRESSIDAIFHEKYLYSRYLEDGSRDYDLEIKYQKIETAVRPIFDKIVKSYPQLESIELNFEEIITILKFSYDLFKRRPEFLKKIFYGQTTEESVEIINAYLLHCGCPLTQTQRELFKKEENRKKFLKNIVIDGIDNTDGQFLQKIIKCNLNFLITLCPKDVFITGSDPIVTNRQMTLTNIPDSIFMYPISSNIILNIHEGSGCNIFGLDNEKVILFNQKILSNSSKIACKDKNTLTNLLS